MLIPNHTCVIVMNVKQIIINKNVKFNEMSIVTHEVMKPDPMLWLVTNYLCHWNKLTHTYMFLMRYELIWYSHLTSNLWSHGYRKNHMLKTDDLRNHLPLIFNKEVDTPPRSTSNSLATHVLVKHGTKVATTQFLTPKVQGIRMHQPLV